MSAGEPWSLLAQVTVVFFWKSMLEINMTSNSHLYCNFFMNIPAEIRLVCTHGPNRCFIHFTKENLP